MGECGCGSTDVMFRFKGPEPDIHYGIELYTGCHYCATPAGVVLHRMGSEFAEDFLDGVEELPLQGYGPDAGNQEVDAQTAIPVFDASHLQAVLTEDFSGVAVEDIEEDDWRRIVQDVIHKTLSGWAGP